MPKFAYLGPKQGSEALRWGEALLASPPRIVAVDIETVSLDDRRLLGIGIAATPDEAIYVPIMPMSDHAADLFVNIISNPGITKIYHNALYDLPVLDDFGADATNVMDTAIMAALLGVPRKLKNLAAELCNVQIQEISDILPKGKSMLDLDYEVVSTKCCNDVMATMMVFHKMSEYVDQSYLAREMQLIPILTRMSKRGIRLDQAKRMEFEQQLQAEKTYLKALSQSYGFNPGSPKQVAFILSDRGCLLPPKNSNWSALGTGEEILLGLSDPLAGLVLAYRKVAKLLGTYITPYAGCDRAYTRFHMFTDTGRLASTDRNLQNVPPEIRSMFLPDHGPWVTADYSQQELRTLAYMSNDTAMQEIFNLGKDIHSETAAFMGIPRRTAKNVTFAMVYGATPETVMSTAKIQSKAKAVELQRSWSARFPQAFAWIMDIQTYGLKHRKVQTLGGRWLYLPWPAEENDAAVIRKACNYPIQGSAAEITKAAMLRCSDLDMMLQVHDALEFDGVDGDEILSRGLDSVSPVLTPMKIEKGKCWK